MLAKDWAGQRFDRLTAIARGHKAAGHRYWLFRCDCGNEIYRVPANVQRNKTNSCPECQKQAGSWAWRGVGDFAQSHYRTLFHGAKARGIDFKVSAEYLWQLFLEQGGACAFTGWSLSFGRSYDEKTSRTASLDRIDSSRGYLPGNLQWVHRDVNKLKKNMSDERFLELCTAVHEYRSLP